ncbi:IS200/IS605 family transposase, partial [Ligilactobacillus ruminis]|uniref:IS200/IS605 family transposase n=1 Tax=Ligilactobacillus ruminis TaxID=1623 RepID=UPI0012D37B11
PQLQTGKKRSFRLSWGSSRYHLILVTKYRRDVLIADIKTELEELLKSMTEQFSGKIIEINIMPDHVHMLIDASPKHSISSMMKGYKGVSARMLFMHHPEIKERVVIVLSVLAGIEIISMAFF